MGSLMGLIDTFQEWRDKDRSNERFYGGAGTIHNNGELDVEVCNGRVVAVWFRCQMLPFRQVQVLPPRAREMDANDRLPSIEGIILEDQEN